MGRSHAFEPSLDRGIDVLISTIVESESNRKGGEREGARESETDKHGELSGKGVALLPLVQNLAGCVPLFQKLEDF